MALTAVVLADTHVRGEGIDGLPPDAREHLATADVILHAGDVVARPLLDDLAALAPVHAVLGNNDVDLVLPETLRIELDGVRVALVHDAGPRTGRERRMSRRFPDADVVVFGHSHVPWNAEGLDGQWLFNPGSATQRRGQPRRTIGILELADGHLRSSQIVPVL